MDDDYKVGDRRLYQEEHGTFEVELVRDLSDERQIGYKLKVVKTISPAARGLKLSTGTTFDWRTPRNFAECGLLDMMGGNLLGKVSE